MNRLFRLCAISVSLAVSLFGQTTSLNGTVSDPTGAVIPNATISIVNVDTGLQREEKSDSQGRYNLEALPPGTYKVTGKASGFADAVLNVRLFVNQPATQNVVFEKVGSTTTTVAVEAIAAQI